MTATLILDVAELPGAACRGVREPLWDDLVHGETRQQRGQRHERAKAICGSCPARAACLAEALRLRDAANPADRPVGIWGGEPFYAAGTSTAPSRPCPHCAEPVYGHAGKRFCSEQCRNNSGKHRRRAGIPPAPPRMDPSAVNDACAGRLPADQLTNDERTEAIRRLTAAGWSASQIAERLRTSIRAVVRHRRKLALQEVA